MPPRFAYWTIIVDDQPTSFRSSDVEDLLPTFNRLKAKNPSAVMMWFQNGKLWPTRVDAQEAMRARGDIGRRSDPRQGNEGTFRKNVEGEGFSPRRDTKPEARGPGEKLDWKPKGAFTPAPPREERREKPEWRPKGSFAPEHRKPRAESWKPKAEKPEWKPKGSFAPESRKPRAEGWKPKADGWKPKGKFSSPKPQVSSHGRSEKLDWKPKGSFDRGPKPDWKAKRAENRAPKAESREPNADGRPEFRDRKKWRPGGDHQDPRQKYKDAKKAKWTKFKQTVRARSASAAKPLRRDKSSRPPKKRDR